MIRETAKDVCAACGGAPIEPFYRTERIPVHSVINIPTYEEALAFPRGELELAFCPECGFIFNRLFEPAKMRYCTQCEETQGFSETFSTWHRKLAQSLVDRYELRNKSVIEIGCGKGEFLTILCELADCHGLGFDPAYVPSRNGGFSERVQFIQDLYSEKYASCQADFICCKMTLEHIDQPSVFLKTLRNAIGERPGVKIFFQVPDVRRILLEAAFWDIYYEHCSYFSLGSLARTFRRAGFEVLDLSSDYAGQYIMVDAQPARLFTGSRLDAEDDLYAIIDAVASFRRIAAERIEAWRWELACLRRQNRRVVLWGSGSKAVSFLSTTDSAASIDYVVDINPYRQGTHLAGNGNRVVAPEFLSEYQPHTVLAMNEIYLEEIRHKLTTLGLNPELRAVCSKTMAAA